MNNIQASLYKMWKNSYTICGRFAIRFVVVRAALLYRARKVDFSVGIGLAED